MDHDDGLPEQVEAIHTDGEMDGDREEIIASKVSADKGSANARATKLAARRLAQHFGGIPGVPIGAKWEDRCVFHFRLILSPSVSRFVSQPRLFSC